MNKRVLLPINTEPAITSRQHNSLALSVFGARAKRAMPWILSNFIHAVYYKSSMWQYDFCIANPWLPNTGLTDCSNLNFNAATADFVSFDRIGLIRTMLSQGYYVRGDFNTAYVKMKKSFGHFTQNAEYLIYGYDDDEKIFYAVGRNSGALFGKYTLKYDEYENAVRKRTDKKFNLNFVRINHDFVPPRSPEAVFDSLAAYLSSKKLEVEKNENKSYGIECFEKFSSYICKMGEIYDNIDIRYAAFFAEHKNVLRSTVGYLADILPGLDSLDLTAFDDICADAGRVYCLLGDYNKTHDYKKAIEADTLIRDITAKEKREIRRILNCRNAMG